jgi:uncharacterized protein YkwD
MRKASTLAVLGILPALLVLGSAGPAGAAFGTREHKLEALVNEARAAAGLAPLAPRARLNRIAERHSRRMVDSGVLSHSDLGKTLPGTPAAEVVGFGPSVGTVFTELMASGVHRDILLGSAWRKTGLGVVRGGGRVWVTQIVRN